MKQDYSVAEEPQNKGDRILLAICAPLASAILGYLVFILHEERAVTPVGVALRWILLEFFSTCSLFSILIVIWAVARPCWIEEILTSTRNRLLRWIIGFTVIGLLGGAVARLLL